MIKNIIKSFLIVLSAALIANAQTSSADKQIKVIDTLSDASKGNFTIESPPAEQSSTSSRTIKYISGFPEDSNKTTGAGKTDAEKQKQDSASGVKNSNDTTPVTQEDIDAQFDRKYKLLKSK